MQKKAKVVFCLVGILMFSSILKGQTYLERSLQLKKTEGQVDLYGKVVDQDDNPVVSARIEYHVTSYGVIYPKYKNGFTFSNEKGEFEIHAKKGGYLYIEDIECRGYDFNRSCQEKASFEFRTSRRDRHHADVGDPVVFYLRKKNHPGTLLLQKGVDIWFTAEEEDKWVACDLGRGADEKKRNRIREGYFWDLEATGELNLEKGEWTVRIKMNGEVACIQRLDELLYEAPSKGYAKEIVFSVPFSEKPPVKHFYARLRNPGVYARFDVAQAYSRDTKLLISCDVFINPYGDRSLERLFTLFSVKKIKDRYNRRDDTSLCQAVDKSGDLFFDNEKKGLQAFREQRLAPRPDFEKWIKEGLAIY